jgi:hypothetical protein
MANWMILSSYKTFGLAWTVKYLAKRLQKQIGVSKKTAWKMACGIVRISLVASINDKSFYQA